MIEKLKKIRDANKGIQIDEVSEKSFERYGKIHKDIDLESAVEYVRENVLLQKNKVTYVASCAALEENEKHTSCLSQKVYGDMPVQIGLCYGYNSKLNGLEYHKGSEVIVAITDIILLVAHFRKLNFHDRITIDSSDVSAFYVEAGTTVELYAGTLHFAPVQVTEEGFKTMIVLPRGTNLKLSSDIGNTGENRLLAAVNKWLITHPELQVGYTGITGENIIIKSIV
jgi:hypothetical protein